MLSLMRKRAGSWMIKIILFVIVVVFSLWGVGNFRERQVTQVAVVNGEVITQQMYADAYEQLRDSFRRAYGDQINESMMQMLRPGEQALNQIVSRVLILQEASRLDLSVADQELVDTIRKIPAFQDNGVFAQARYLTYLARSNSSPEQFEQVFKDEMLVDKLRNLIMSGVHASEEEALAWYQMNNAEVSLDYMLFSPEKHKGIELTDEELAAYYKEHENQYRTAPRIKARYLYFDPDAYKAKVTLTDEEVANYYKEHPEQFKTEKTISASHILFKVDENADEKTVAERKKAAMDIYDLAKQGRDFAKLATQYSEGPSKSNGGSLGTFGRGAMVKPFADKAFAMKAGEISEPVWTKFGWHLIKVEKINAATSKSLAEASPQIRSQQISAKAKDLAREDVEKVYDSVFDGDDLSDTGKTYQVPVKTTDFFAAEGMREPGIDDPQKFTKIAFGLRKMDISDIETLGKRYYLIQVIDRVEAHIPELATVSKKVRKDLIKARQDEKAKSDAQAFLEKVKAGASLDETGAEYNVKPGVTGFFKRTGSIPKIGFEAKIAQSAFLLSAESPLHEQPINGRQGWYVIRLKERKLPSADGFEKEKAAALKRLTDQKKRETFQRWVDNLRARSTVKINQEQIMTP